jgi:NAD(P)-dependent dehydrogenase (short-subunit alcohol dehydrogenase family)
MIKRHKEQKMRSLVVFTSSMAAVAPAPYGAVYSATKILNDFFTWGLEYELAEHAIDVCSWRAAGVTTKLNGYKKDLLTTTPEHFVKCGFAKVTSGVHSGYFVHELIHTFLTNMQDIWPSGPTHILSYFFSQEAKQGRIGETAKKSQ